MDLWLVWEPGGNDMPASLFGVFTSEEIALRAADVCSPDGYKTCLNVDRITADAIYKNKAELAAFWDVANFFSYPQAEPDTDWDHQVVDVVEPAGLVRRDGAQ